MSKRVIVAFRERRSPRPAAGSLRSGAEEIETPVIPIKIEASHSYEDWLEGDNRTNKRRDGSARAAERDERSTAHPPKPS
ncbi:unnamed protein product [Colias eurytheme]|nr:unnamed protein product [Colias eurytheme]